jgi:hypothetical protein
MQRGQATIEYLLLVTALMLSMCLLVRYPTPVEWMARAIAHAVSHRPATHRHHGGGRHHASHRHPHPCVCPIVKRGRSPAQHQHHSVEGTTSPDARLTSALPGK